MKASFEKSPFVNKMVHCKLGQNSQNLMRPSVRQWSCNFSDQCSAIVFVLRLIKEDINLFDSPRISTYTFSINDLVLEIFENLLMRNFEHGFGFPSLVLIATFHFLRVCFFDLLT